MSIHTYYFHHQSASHQGKSARRHRCFQADQTLLLEARSTRIGRPIPITFKADLDHPEIELRFRKSFALSGKIDIFDTASQTAIGVTTRSRKLFTVEQRPLGRFHDTRSWKEHFGAVLIDTVGQLVVGGDGSDDGGNAAHAFVFSLDKTPLATLSRGQLPFFPDPPKKTQPGAIGKMLKKILPRNLGHALIDITPPSGWALQIHQPFPDTDLRLLLCSTLMTIELNRWS